MANVSCAQVSLAPTPKHLALQPRNSCAVRVRTKFSGVYVVLRTDAPARILITRTEPGAATLAAALTAAGFDALRYPVLEIRPLDPAANRRVIARLDQFDVVIFVSTHAVTLGMALIDEFWRVRPSQLMWIAVGGATAAALAQRGIVAVVPVAETSEGILALPETRTVTGQHVLLVAGLGGRTELAEGLAKRGAEVEMLTLYERAPIVAPRSPRFDRIAAVVVSSADGARAFAMHWRAAHGDFDVPVIAPSARVAKVLRELRFGSVVESAGAGAAAVVEAARNLMGNSDE